MKPSPITTNGSARIRASRPLSALSTSPSPHASNPVLSSTTDQITIDRIDNRDILLLYEKDVQTFDSILQFRRMGRGNITAAFDEFCPYGGDALVKIAYADASTHWDAVLVYTLGDSKQDNIRLSFLHALLMEGLLIDREVAPDGLNVFVKIVAPFERLCVEAEREKLKFPVQERQASRKVGTLDISNADALWNGVVNILKVPSTDEKHSATFRRDQLQRFVGGNTAALPLREVHERFFSHAQRSLLTYHIIYRARMKSLGKKYARRDIDRLLNDGVFTDLFPLHDGQISKLNNTNLRSQMFNKRELGILPVRLNDLRDYFGEKIALYFGWLEHYTRWLGFASIIGCVVFAYGLYYAYQNQAFSDISKDDILSGDLGKVQSKATLIFDNWATMPFAFAISVWVGRYLRVAREGASEPYFNRTLYLEFWSRRNKSMAWQWDVMRYEKEERTRPKWYATTVRRSHITHRVEPHFPTRAQRWILLFTSIVYIFILLFVIATVGGFIVFNVWIKVYFKNHLSNYVDYAGTVSSVVSLVTITLVTPVTYWLSRFLTDLENHKTETQYQDARRAKTMLFDFVNNFGSLFYVGVVKRWITKMDALGLTEADWGNSDTTQDGATKQSYVVELTVQMAITFLGKSLLSHLYHWGIPWLARKRALLSQRMSKPTTMHHTPVFPAESPVLLVQDIESSNQRTRVAVPTIVVQQAVHDIKLVPFHVQEGPTENGYNSSVVQFGFIVLFSVAFPLAPLFAMLHNCVQLRIDAHNLLVQYRRPFALQAQDIGMWEVWLRGVSSLSVFLNACIIAFSSDFFYKNYLKQVPNWVNMDGLAADSPIRASVEEMAMWAARIGFILVFEHAVFGIKVFVAWLLPDVPPKVRRALEREEFVNKVLRGEENEDEPEEDVHPDDLGRSGCCVM
ncbi:Anoctamin-7 [Rhizophlyctis rosea]|nr:Anoctamin-7 [Rhizophlyctis rosea]